MAYYKLVFIKKYRLLLLTVFFFLVANAAFYLTMPEFKEILFEAAYLDQEAIKNHGFFLAVFTLSALVSSLGLSLFFNVLLAEDESQKPAKRKILKEEEEIEKSIKDFNMPKAQIKKEVEMTKKTAPKEAPKKKLIQH